MENIDGLARMKQVRRVLNEGGCVRFDWCSCSTVLISAEQKIDHDGRAGQRLILASVA